MIGGGLDYINDKNGVLYNNKNIIDKMKISIEKYNNYKGDENIQYLVNEKYTIHKFLNTLYKLFNYEIKYDFTTFNNNCNTKHLYK